MSPDDLSGATGRGPTSPIRAISASAGNAWVVDTKGNILRSVDRALTWQVRWSAQTPLSGIWLRATEVVAVGAAGTILYSADGGLFTQQASGVRVALNAVWCGAADCFAVGAEGVILHGSALGWNVEPAPAVRTLRAVSGSAGRVFVVGDGGTILMRSLK